MKDNIWREVATAFSGKTDEDCKKRWRSIRDHYKRLKREGKLGTGSAARKGTNWPLLKYLTFLTNVSEERRSHSNISDLENHNSTVNEDSVLDYQIDPEESSRSHSNISGNSSVIIESVFGNQMDSEENVYFDDSASVNSPSKSDTCSIPKKKKRNQSSDRVTEILIQNKDSRKQMLQTLSKIKNVEDDIDFFYKSIAMSVKKLPPHLISEAKMQNLQTLQALQLKYTQNQQQQYYYHLPPQQSNLQGMQQYSYQPQSSMPKTFYQPLETPPTHSSVSSQPSLSHNISELQQSNLQGMQQYPCQPQTSISKTFYQPLETPPPQSSVSSQPSLSHNISELP